jgi:hypothetical protein
VTISETKREKKCDLMNLTAISQRHPKCGILKKETKNHRNKLLLLLTRESERRRKEGGEKKTSLLLLGSSRSLFGGTIEHATRFLNDATAAAARFGGNEPPRRPQHYFEKSLPRSSFEIN